MATQHISVSIERSADAVYEYASDPQNLSEWAAGLANASLEDAGNGKWTMESPMGLVSVEFTETNTYGVLDHTVTIPSGEVVLNPMRVIPNGENASEVIFTIRQRSMTDDEFENDTQMVVKDLTELKRRVETAG